jgi:type II secretory pathway pseudopilin PulG
VTLVELIVFIVIAGVVATALVAAFGGSTRGSHYGKELTQATHLAQQRIDVILGQRKRFGYAGFTAGNYDPCQLGIAPFPASQACQTTVVPAGSYVVSSATSSFAANACGAGTGTNCRLIVVTVTSPTDGSLLARLTAQVWNF